MAVSEALVCWGPFWIKRIKIIKIIRSHLQLFLIDKRKLVHAIKWFDFEHRLLKITPQMDDAAGCEFQSQFILTVSAIKCTRCCKNVWVLAFFGPFWVQTCICALNVELPARMKLGRLNGRSEAKVNKKATFTVWKYFSLQSGKKGTQRDPGLLKQVSFQICHPSIHLSSSSTPST